MDLANPCTQDFRAAREFNKSGIVFFPGGAGFISKNGALVADWEWSGDGVDQDDYVTSGGTAGFERLRTFAPIKSRIRACGFRTSNFPGIPLTRFSTSCAAPLYFFVLGDLPRAHAYSLYRF